MFSFVFKWYSSAVHVCFQTSPFYKDTNQFVELGADLTPPRHPLNLANYIIIIIFFFFGLLSF